MRTEASRRVYPHSSRWLSGGFFETPTAADHGIHLYGEEGSQRFSSGLTSPYQAFRLSVIVGSSAADDEGFLSVSTPRFRRP